MKHGLLTCEFAWCLTPAQHCSMCEMCFGCVIEVLGRREESQLSRSLLLVSLSLFVVSVGNMSAYRLFHSVSCGYYSLSLVLVCDSDQCEARCVF